MFRHLFHGALFFQKVFQNNKKHIHEVIFFRMYFYINIYAPLSQMYNKALFYGHFACGISWGISFLWGKICVPNC